MKRLKLGIIGYPLSHTLSPLMHQAALKDLGLVNTYDKWSLEPLELPTFIANVRKVGSLILGFNVTIPYKEKIIEYLDVLSPEAKLIGAVNTVKWEEGLLKGYNTDGKGLIKSLESEGEAVGGKSVLLIGTGGAAKGIAIALALGLARKVDLVGRNKESGLALKKQIEQINSVESKFYPWQYLLEGDLKCYDVVIQTTPVGMSGMGGDISINYDQLKKNTSLLDIIYNPKETDFLKKGRLRGFKTINGQGMLVHQGALALNIWLGVNPNIKVMEVALEQ